MPKTTVILNPTAGRGAGARMAPQIAARLRDYGLDFELLTTSGPVHARELACQAVMQGRQLVITVGGDGTANEALNGLMQAGCNPDDIALAILPIGTGNDFAFSAGLPLNLEDAFQVVVRGQSRVLDVGWMRANNEEPRYFGNGVGIGFDAMANIESRKLTRLRGFLLYLVAVLRTLAFYYDAPLAEIRTDREAIIQPSLLISVMNGYRMGGGFHITPGSQMDDGLLDLCIGAKMGRLRMIGFVPQFIRGTHTKDPLITMCQGRKVTVTSESPWAAHVDGEIYGVGATHFEIELLPQRLRLIC